MDAASHEHSNDRISVKDMTDIYGNQMQFFSDSLNFRKWHCLWTGNYDIGFEDLESSCIP